MDTTDKPPRSRKRKIFFWSGGIILLLLLLIILLPSLVGVLGKSLIERAIAEGSGMQASIGDLSLGWSTAHIDQLHLQGAEFLQSFSLEEAQANFSVWDFIFSKTAVSIELVKPKIHLVNRKPSLEKKPDNDGETTEPGAQEKATEPINKTASKPKESSPITQLPFASLDFRLKDAEIILEQPGESAQGKIAGLQFQFKVNTQAGNFPLLGNCELDIAALQLPAQLAGGQAVNESQIQFRLQGLKVDALPGCAQFAALSLRSASKQLSLDGKLSCDGADQVQGQLQFQLASAALLPWVQGFLPAQIKVQGEAKGTFKIQGPVASTQWQDWSMQGSMSLPQIEYEDMHLSNGSLEILHKNGEFVLEKLYCEADGKPIEVAGKAHLFAAQPTIAFSAQWQGVPLKKAFLPALEYPIPFLHTEEENMLQVRGATTGNLQMQTHGADKEQLTQNLTAEGKIELTQVELSGPSTLAQLLPGIGNTITTKSIQAPFKIASGMLTTPGIVLQAKDFSLSLSGTTSLSGELDYKITAELSQRLTSSAWGQKLQEFLNTQGMPAHLSGTIQNPKISFQAPELKEELKDTIIDSAFDLLQKKKKKSNEK